MCGELNNSSDHKHHTRPAIQLGLLASIDKDIFGTNLKNVIHTVIYYTIIIIISNALSREDQCTCTLDIGKIRGLYITYVRFMLYFTHAS